MPQTFSIVVRGTTPSTFDPIYQVRNGSSRVVKTTIDNNISFTANSLSYVIPDTNTHSVDISLSDIKYMTYIQMNSDGVVGTVDLSEMKSLRIVEFGENPEIRNIISPTNSNIFIEGFSFTNCGLTGSINLSGYNGMQILNLNNNPNLKEIILPRVNVFNPNSAYTLTSLGLTGTVDLSKSMNIRNIYLSSSNNINSLTFSNEVYNTMQLLSTSSGLTGSLDLSNFNRLFILALNGNTNLKYVKFPKSNMIWFGSTDGGTQQVPLQMTNTIGLTGVDLSETNGMTGYMQFSGSSLETFYPPKNKLQKSLQLDSTPKLTTIDFTGSENYRLLNFGGPSMSSATLPKSTYVTSFKLFPSGVSYQTLDFSKIYSFGNFDLTNCTNLRNIVFGTGSKFVNGSNTSGNQRFIQILSTGVTGSLNFSNVNNIGGYIDIGGNPNIKEIVFATSSTNVQRISVYSNSGLTGSLNLSPIGNVIGDIVIYSNTNLGSINFGSQSNNIGTLNVYSCPNINGLDLSGFKDIGVYNKLDGNTNMKYLNMPLNYCNSTYFTFLTSYCGLSGSLDLSNNPHTSRVELNNNTNLTSITFGTSSISNCFNTRSNYTRIETSDVFNLSSCNLTGTLDLRMRYSLSTLNASNNVNLTTILHTQSLVSVNNYYVNNCGLSGSHDISMLDLYGFAYLHTNPNLTNITNPNTNRSILRYYAYNCNLTGTFSISGFSGYLEEIQVYGNPNLNKIILPTSNKSVLIFSAHGCSINDVNFTSMPNFTNWNSCSIYLQNNGMTTSVVNKILYDLDQISISGYSSRVINISGTNAAPDASGYNGLSAKSSLQSKGFTVTTN